MYGFIGTFGNNDAVPLYCEPHGNQKTVFNEINCDSLSIKRLTLDKFIKDKVVYESDKVVIILEGVVYNFAQLEYDYSCTDRGKLLEIMYLNHSASFLANALNGFFSGMIFDKTNRKLCLITDHISYKPIWYSVSRNKIVFSTDIHWLYSTLSNINDALRIDYDGIYCLLNYGYMLGDITPIKGCKKLLAGNVAEFQNGALNIINYYTVPNVNINLERWTKAQYKEYLSKIDAAFENSVKRVYQKDEEYGYKHCMTLSGGLDSRLVLFMAHRLGYKTLCLTMGESNCNDIRISSKICHDLRMEHIIYELDNGRFLFDIDSAIEGNGGTVLYPGFAHTFRLKSLLDLDEYGAVHSGDLGDLILGGSLAGDKDTIDLTAAMYSSCYIDGFSEEFKKEQIEKYPDSFRFNYYNRGLNSAGNGCFATCYFTECSSPFVDKDLCNLLFSIPEDYIKEHKLYLDYMQRYVPHSCDYIWEKTACKPNASLFEKKYTRWKQRFQHRILKKTISMNPFNNWYAENKDLREYFAEIHMSGEWIKTHNPTFYEDLEKRYSSDNFMDKSLACTIIRLINKYQIEL